MSVFSRSTSGNGEHKSPGDDSGAWSLGSAGQPPETQVDNVKATPGDGPVNSAQPTQPLTSDGTLPIEIVDPSNDTAGLVVDERGLPESVAGELPRAAGSNPATSSPPPTPQSGPPVVHAPPPLPLPANAPRVRARARTAGERPAAPVASTPAPLNRNQVLERLQRGEALRGVSLRGVDLSNAKLGPADLTRADLERADLRGAHLEKANLRGASLRGARLGDADLRGANLESADLSEADLRGANLIQANLTLARIEDADLTGANLAGADMSLAQLRSTKLAGANLKDANFTHAHLVRAGLGGVKALGADFVDADMRGASLAEGDFTGAEFTEARMAGVDARRAKLGGVSLVDADLRRADLSRADLSHADLRRADLSQAVLAGAALTGAKIEGMVPAGVPAEGLLASWVDASAGADGSHRLEGGAALAAITGAVRDAAPTEERRYFGRGDVVKNASFDFGQSARVEIDSRLEGCTIVLGEGAQLVVGQAGALLDCQVRGGATVVVHGRVFEREAPAIAGAGAILVGGTGRLQGSVEQRPGGTRFGFDRGCQLRLTIASPPDVPSPEVPATSTEGDGASADGLNDGRVRGRMPVTPSSGIAAGTDGTVVGPAARFEGKLRTDGDILVRGSVDGALEARRIEVDERGSVSGRMKATELRAWGTSSGILEAETIELGGQLRDGAVVRAATLVVRWDESSTAVPVRFGAVTLEVGPPPSRDEPIVEPTVTEAEPPASLAAETTGDAAGTHAVEATNEGDSEEAVDDSKTNPRAPVPSTDD